MVIKSQEVKNLKEIPELRASFSPEKDASNLPAFCIEDLSMNISFKQKNCDDTT